MLHQEPAADPDARQSGYRWRVFTIGLITTAAIGRRRGRVALDAF